MNRSYESHMTVGVERKFRNLENRIMEDVVRRIKKTGQITSSADYQLNRYYILGNSTKDIEDIVKSAVGDDYPETFKLYDEVVEKQYTRSRELYEQVNEEFIPYEQNEQLQQLVNGLIQQSNDELYNITRSMGFMVDMGGGRKVFSPLSDYYNQYLDNAIVEITSGAFDYNTVIRRVVGQMTNSGLRTVDYASGYSSRCDVAARRAIMTGLSQLTGHISQTNAQKLHTEYFEIDWHAGARPSHRTWQGKVWSYRELVTVCGLGTVTGLQGANCYHEYYPFIPGISERQFSDKWLAEQNRKEDRQKVFKGKEYTLYEATQRQRYLETNMRAQRQKVKLLQQAGASQDDIMLARCKYQAQLDEYKAFCERMGLQEQRERIYYDLQGRVAPGRRTAR
ncbi:minor capsid protein [Enterocloster clostridioformis]|uniref:phage minor capsid protein n=1 Tax=Enterocloster bolteae TaxID=208479 RepID=UPI000E425D5C|nr:phage minor capsid protein [Enterocloster bolteae]RGB80490.1 minor capsid protein [Enterocloster clostridioformis]RGS06858.1 minor capsid protein [Enterocloster bolteae]